MAHCVIKKHGQICIQIIKKSDFIKTHSCGFGLCPKKYKYLANPQLLEEISTNTNSQIVGTVKSTRQNISKTIDVKRTICLPGTEDSPFDSMRTTNCIGCNQKYLLRVDNPICVSCRGIY